jgi:hypothetical protein
LLPWIAYMYFTLWVCVCSLCYPACKAHAPYCQLWPVRLDNIFPLHFINDMIFRKKKKLSNVKCVFWFSLQLLSETFLILWRIQRDAITNVRWSSCKVPVILVRLQWNMNILDRFRKFPKNQISQKFVHWGPRPCGRTDRHDNANSRF